MSTDKLWCGGAGQWRYIDVCHKCGRRDKCSAYIEWKAPKLI